MIDVFSRQADTLDAYEPASAIVKASGIISDAMNDHSAESLSRIDNVQELLKAIYEFSEEKKRRRCRAGYSA